MLDLVVGEKRNPIAADSLIAELSDLATTGTLYIGYPVLASADEPIVIDALLTSIDQGVVVFDLASDVGAKAEIAERQDDMYNAIRQKLSGNRALRNGRNLAVSIVTISIAPTASGVTSEDGMIIAPPTEIVRALEVHGVPISRELLQSVNATIQRVGTIKPPRRRGQIKRDDSRGGRIREIEQQIANLDSWQKSAAIESPEGPQRIRGLAGSGKTIVLALKAAYLHVRNPESNIVVTFHTRSLYQQFRDLIRRFTFEQTNDEPDWTRLRVMHSWGSASQAGLYSEIASAAEQPIRNFTSARNQFGYENAFGGACDELLDAVRKSHTQPAYDAILIDEAQDLPRSFFELAYLMSKAPHRVIFAYDELQNLTDHSMLPPTQLFGVDEGGSPRVGDLTNEHGRASQDIVLPVCYRNTPWALTIAHALGFGIYREGNLVQFFDQPTLWPEIGYEKVSGDIAPEHHVVLKRRADATPPFFARLVKPDDSVICQIFADKLAQADWVADEVKRNLADDELNASDVLIILANPLTARAESGPIARALAARGIASHLAGVTSSVDELFEDDSVAITGIYRAKGNEAAMVYVLNCDYGVPAVELIKRRNILFTAITRSRAWVRLCGIGDDMAKIKTEVDKVVAHSYQLDFTLPTAQEMDRLRRVHSELSQATRQKIQRVTTDLDDLIQAIERGDLPVEALPPNLLRRIRESLKSDE